MTEKDLISIIVPVYNTAAFLPSCLDSLVNQSYSNLEIILVNDGSTDDSRAVCLKYASRDQRIILLENEVNRGPGASRNAAFRIAKGKFIGFSDSDDAADLNQFRRLHELITETVSDIAVCGVRTTPARSPKEPTPETKILGPKEAAVEFLTNSGFGAFSCNKLFNSFVIKAAGLYPEDMVYEDIVYIPQACIRAGKIVMTTESLYYYRQHTASVTRSPFTPRKMEQLKAYDLLVPVLLDKFPEIKNLVYEKAWFAIMGIFNTLARSTCSDNEYYKILLSKARVYRKGVSLKTANNKKRAFIFAAALLMPRVYSFLLNKLYDRKRRLK